MDISIKELDAETCILNIAEIDNVLDRSEERRVGKECRL